MISDIFHISGIERFGCLGRVRVSHGQGNILENIIFKWGEKND
jgi:hypothetical protein